MTYLVIFNQFIVTFFNFIEYNLLKFTHERSVVLLHFLLERSVKSA